MAASLGSYVDDLPGLSPEELERALAATETAPAPVAPTPAEMEGAAAAAAAPSAPAPPAPPAPEAALDAPIQRSAAKGFKATVRDYQDQEIADANKRLELAGRAGDETAMTHTKTAALRHEQSDEAKSALDTAKADAAEHRKKRKEYEKKSDETFAEAEANKSPPDASVMQKVMGVLAGLAAMGGQSAHAAQGFQMIGSLFAPDRDKWERERKANSDLYQMATRGVDMNKASEEQDYQIASRLDAAKAVEVDAAIDAVMKEGLSEEGLRAAEKLKLDVRQHARDRLTNFAEQEEAARLKAEADAAAAAARAAKAKRAGELSRKEQWFWARSLEELDAMPNDVLGEEGQKIRTEMRKAKQSGEGAELENLGKRKKLEEEEASGEGQEILPGVVATIPLEKKDVSDIRSNAQALEKIKENYKQLAKIRERNKGSLFSSADDKTLAGNILSEMSGTINQMSGRGAPSEGERQDMIKQLQDPTDTYLIGNPEKVYKANIDRLDNNFRAGLEAVGATRRDGSPLRPKTLEEGVAGGVKKRAIQGRAPDASAPVTLIRPSDGKPFQVHPANAQKLRDKGWSDAPVEGGSYIAQEGDFFAQGGGRQ